MPHFTEHTFIGIWAARTTQRWYVLTFSDISVLVTIMECQRNWMWKKVKTQSHSDKRKTYRRVHPHSYSVRASSDSAAHASHRRAHATRTWHRLRGSSAQHRAHQGLSATLTSSPCTSYRPCRGRTSPGSRPAQRWQPTCISVTAGSRKCTMWSTTVRAEGVNAML